MFQKCGAKTQRRFVIQKVAAPVCIDVCRALIRMYAYTRCDTFVHLQAKGTEVVNKQPEHFPEAELEWDLLMDKLEAFTFIHQKLQQEESSILGLRKVKLRVINFRMLRCHAL